MHRSHLLYVAEDSCYYRAKQNHPEKSHLKVSSQHDIQNQRHLHNQKNTKNNITFLSYPLPQKLSGKPPNVLNRVLTIAQSYFTSRWIKLEKQTSLVYGHENPRNHTMPILKLRRSPGVRLYPSGIYPDTPGTQFQRVDSAMFRTAPDNVAVSRRKPFPANFAFTAR